MDLKMKNHRGPGIKGWRLIVRNLSFKTKEEDIRQWAGHCGNILDIQLPKSKDKRFPESCAGFCFIQFARRNDAEKARRGLNFTELNSRKVAVDWALDKDTWVTKEQEAKCKINVEPKEEPIEEDNIELDVGAIKKAKCKINVEPKEESMQDENVELDVDAIKKEIQDFDSEPDDEEYNTCESGAEENQEEEDRNTASIELRKKKIKASKREERQRCGDNSVCEGRVIFIRNLPFGATDEQLKEWLEDNHFGQVKLAILCRSKQTRDPTGSAFVHFAEKSSADAFLDKLTSAEGMLFDGRRLIGHRAVPLADAKEFKKRDDESGTKDKRNLYLLRASLIRPGTAQANGMSEEDAKFREKLAQLAREKLKNLIMFVSPTRLVIHNIPFSLTDTQLRAYCQQKTIPQIANAITECRIMRDVKGTNKNGKPLFGKSKGFGFVNFRDHSSALQCLKQMNNDPHLFTNERRPVVEFSIENLTALRTKERRLKLSRGEEVDNNILKRKCARELSGDDSMMVERTKKELMAHGQKWMPKKLGRKIRHRDIGGGQTSKSGTGKIVVQRRRKRISDNGGTQKKKARKNGGMTKH